MQSKRHGAGGLFDGLLYYWSGQTEFYSDVARHRQALLFVIAAIRYERRLGSWPSSAEQLIPEFLEGTPIDPWTKRPLGCAQSNGQFTVFLPPPPGKPQNKAETLWPPQER